MWAVERPLVLAQKCWGMIPTPLLRKMMSVWPRSIVLEGPAASENMISVLESYWQYCLDVLSMVDYSILEYHQVFNAFGTGSQADHRFRKGGGSFSTGIGPLEKTPLVHSDRSILTWQTQKYRNSVYLLFPNEATVSLLSLQSYAT